MKKICLAIVALACITGSSTDAQESSWFDLENCAICKNMSSVKDLMSNIKWENHVIPNGVLSISVIPEKYKEKMETAHEGMEATIERLKSGEAMELCGFCTSYGALMQAGAESTDLKTIGGDISMLTSDDPAVVEKIQAHGQKTIDEFKKMMAHEGHDESSEHRHDQSHEKEHKSAG